MNDFDLSDSPRVEGGVDELRWQQCKTFEGACELTALWLEGRSHYLPGYMAAGPATETGPISESLAAINRLGFLTEDSQPGLRDQRAYVTGYVQEYTMGMLSRILSNSELVMICFPPGTTGESQICVSLDGKTEFTWLGRFGGASDLKDTYGSLNDALWLDLSRCWGLQIFDPVWGRNARLLPALTIALEAAAG
ncbi:DUF6919 domain-containing protein [Arthrobacter sp. D2-10]